MPSSSEKQRRFFGAVYSCKTKGKCSTEKIKSTADSMPTEKIKDFLRKETKQYLKFSDYVKIKESKV